ncbi:MAG TPA: hypothetical protein PLT36_07750 [Erysipelotrichaceae bacterium]|jgi:hypothetical protein|nr:hypothetical protein [Erysipelotrichaceae bacterium]HQA85650.1 hypothetical protein [Erysipelotrichaceae bacterium]
MSQYFKTLDEVSTLVCDFALNNAIFILFLGKIRKTEGNELFEKEDLIKLVVNEFVHICKDFIFLKEKYL